MPKLSFKEEKREKKFIFLAGDLSKNTVYEREFGGYFCIISGISGEGIVFNLNTFKIESDSISGYFKVADNQTVILDFN